MNAKLNVYREETLRMNQQQNRMIDKTFFCTDNIKLDGIPSKIK